MPDRIKHAREWLGETDQMFSKRGIAPEMPIKSIRVLNDFLWGLHRQEMTVIGSRPSNGKSVLAIQLAWDMAKQGHSVYFMSLEMPAPRIIERIFSNECLVDNSNLWRGVTHNDETVKYKYEVFKRQLSSTRLVISDMIGRTVQDIENINKAFETYPDVFIIDHLNEISADQNKHVVIEKYLSTIREMAIRRNTALVVCCQVNRVSRSEDDKRPQLHQLKGSGSAEEKADNVVLLHWNYLYSHDESEKNKLQVMVAKNRYGATGFGEVYFHPEYSRLSDDGCVFKVPERQEAVAWQE
jgi:replicative DNA helicase